MISLSYTLLTLIQITFNSAERWFSAGVSEKFQIQGYPTSIGTDKPLRPIEHTEFRPNHIASTSEQRFLPIEVSAINSRSSEEDTSRLRFTERKLHKSIIGHDSIPHTNEFSTNEYQNTRTKSRKNKVRKRCVEACSLKNLGANQTRKRFLEVFQVVKFDNVPCTSSSGLEGTCLHVYECQTSGGTAMGSCADGYGVCCVTLLPCDSESSAVVGWFTNPDYPLPSSGRLSCAVAVIKASEDITQIRLDFSTFEMFPPTNGICQEDQFIVSGQNVNNVIPILCGINTGQHVYVEVGESDGPIYLSIQTINPENRLFSVKITQLTPSKDLAAPPGCLQYFTEPKGYIESFNYRARSDISIARTPSYLNNLNYAMCIERVSGSCSVTYTNAGYLQIINYDNDGLPVIPPGQAGVEIFNCPSDWLLISATRLCGDRFNDGTVLQDFSLNAPITDNSAGPIVVWFRSDEGYVGRGFKIQYEQISCTST